MNNPPRYPRTPHWPWSEKVHRDDSYHINPEFFVGKEVVITEKLDGGNTCLHAGEVYARSVTSPSHDGWMAMVRKNHAWKVSKLLKDMTFYGEDLYGIHSIEYDPMYEQDTFNLFSIRHNKMNVFFSWASIASYANQYGFRTVPVCFQGTFKSVEAITQWFKDNRPTPSSLGPEKEGFVMRTSWGFDADQFSTNVCKYVRNNHVQTDEHWTRNWKPCKIIR